MIVAITVGDNVAGRARVPGGIDDVRRHGPGQVGIQGKRQQIGLESVRLHERQREMAVHPGAAVARRMLAHRLHAGGQQPGRERAP